MLINEFRNTLIEACANIRDKNLSNVKIELSSQDDKTVLVVNMDKGNPEFSVPLSETKTLSDGLIDLGEQILAQIDREVRETYNDIELEFKTTTKQILDFLNNESPENHNFNDYFGKVQQLAGESKKVMKKSPNIEKYNNLYTQWLVLDQAIRNFNSKLQTQTTNPLSKLNHSISQDIKYKQQQ